MLEESETVITVVANDLEERTAVLGQACLVAFYGRNIGKRYFLERPEIIIGRSDSADIQVEQDSVSRRHAKITTHAGRAWLCDLDSTNGSFVNDKAVEDCELCDGDLIRIGQTIFKFLTGSNIESRYHEEVYRLTTIDGLTHAFNKRFFLEALERELHRVVRYGHRSALTMCDIDHFKEINDTHGHLAGDHVLRELCRIIADNLRREDVFARYGGEEFAIILPEIDGPHAVQVAEKLRGLVEAHEFSFANELIPVTMSFGVHAATGEEEHVEVTGFIADADANLYRAKVNGRNRVWFSP